MVPIRGLLVVAMLVTSVSASRADPGDYEDGSYQHTIPAGKRFQIGNARSWNPECQSTGGAFRITQGPSHGTLSQDRVMSAIPDGRGQCSGQPATATRLFYTPSARFSGQEHIGYDEIYGNGGHRHVDEDLTITPALVELKPGQVLHEVPAPGTLDVPTGTAVLIDDRTCPAGQIKQMIAGRMNPPIPRSFSCVPR